MPSVIVEATAPVASWRAPEALTYHRTLPLPPYTTQVGVLGAALGIDLESAYRFVADHRLRLGVGGWHDGHARDLWKHQKLKDKEVERDILLREHLIDVRLVLVVEAGDGSTAGQIAGAFQRPAYPLTAGTSDALMRVVKVRIDETPPQTTHCPFHALIYSEISSLYAPYEDIAKIPLTRTVQAPRIERLPTGFRFDKGGRTLAGRALVTFVADPIRLNEGEPPLNGYRVIPESNLLCERLSLWEELPWIIPVHRYD